MTKSNEARAVLRTCLKLLKDEEAPWRSLMAGFKRKTGIDISVEEVEKMFEHSQKPQGKVGPKLKPRINCTNWGGIHKEYANWGNIYQSIRDTTMSTKLKCMAKRKEIVFMMYCVSVTFCKDAIIERVVNSKSTKEGLEDKLNFILEQLPSAPGELIKSNLEKNRTRGNASNFNSV